VKGVSGIARKDKKHGGKGLPIEDRNTQRGGGKTEKKKLTKRVQRGGVCKEKRSQGKKLSRGVGASRSIETQQKKGERKGKIKLTEENPNQKDRKNVDTKGWRKAGKFPMCKADTTSRGRGGEMKRCARCQKNTGLKSNYRKNQCRKETDARSYLGEGEVSGNGIKTKWGTGFVSRPDKERREPYSQTGWNKEKKKKGIGKNPKKKK